jgi:hypothetical protein
MVTMAVSLKRRISLPLVINAGVSSLILALGMTPTFSAFTASISGLANSAGSGTIIMRESNSSGTITCLSTDGGGLAQDAASCSGINKYGGESGMSPGSSAIVVTYIQDVGTLAASSFSLTPGACLQSAAGTSSGSATNFCDKITVSITSGSSTIFSGTASALGGTGTIDVLARLGLTKFQLGVQIPLTVTATVDSAIDNSYQGLRVSQSLTWTFSA